MAQETHCDHAQVYGFVHIPKAAGSSFVVWTTPYIPGGDGYYSQEICPSQVLQQCKLGVQQGRGNLSGVSFELLTFLRAPRAHVYSQYLELKYDDVWHWAGKDKFIQEFQNITHFLDRFTSGEGTNHSDYLAYHPQDMQTRSLVCDRDNHGYHELHAADLERALENVHNFKFIGIVEFYQASTCVFLDKVQPGNLLPDFCDCQNKTKWSSFDHPHIAHGVPEHSLNDLSSADVSKIDRLTQMDLTVYKAGLKRWYSEVHELEQRRGLRIHCK